MSEPAVEHRAARTFLLVHDGPFLTYVYVQQVIVTGICAAGAVGTFVLAATGVNEQTNRWFLAGMAVLFAALTATMVRRGRRYRRAMRAVRRDPGRVTIDGHRLVVDCPALLTEPLVVEQAAIASVGLGRAGLGFSANHGTRLTLSWRKPHARVNLVRPMAVPQARNVPSDPTPYTLPSSRRDTPRLVLRFADGEPAARFLQAWAPSGP